MDLVVFAIGVLFFLWLKPRISVNKPGANIGAGFAFGTKWHAKFYAEARWNHVFGAYGGPRMDYVPVTFGVRW